MRRQADSRGGLTRGRDGLVRDNRFNLKNEQEHNHIGGDAKSARSYLPHVFFLTR